MRILLTGATGYIGKRLLPALLEEGHEVICCVRDKKRFDQSKFNSKKLSVVEVDFLEEKTLNSIPEDIDSAYYLIHSMSASINDFARMEEISARNFTKRISGTRAQQVIYLSGIVNEEKLSRHLQSRKQVEEVLSSGSFHLTTLRAGIIVGSGSASFEIIRDLVEKLPVMIAPRWLKTRTHPISIWNVIQFLKGVLLKRETFDKSFDIGGPEILTYKDMLLKYAKVRNLKRTIISVPVMTPKLSSYWLYFVTSTSYKLAVNLVNSMKVEVVGRENNLKELLDIRLVTYEEAVRMALDKVSQHDVASSWTDALSSRVLDKGISELTEVPEYGCFKDVRKEAITDEDKTLEKLWAIGGKNGWYHANWLWEIRGFLDKLAGGVGLRRGRRSPDEIVAGDSLDFWRVLYANKQEKRLLLYAEMRLPGEAWLEFNIKDGLLHMIATFRPRGLWGRLYWYSVLPFHGMVFKGMINKMAE